ncbi:MAG: hypothetical protein WC934_11675 [Acidithiobacillus sp.]|jgi:hypothetical protein|uniref:hypothetical protein n=1 Tax=Acidithiobacillus sp. TaxID=1872118 RepID=UPI00355D3C98
MKSQNEILFETLQNDCKEFNVEFKGTKLEILNNLEKAVIKKLGNSNLCKNKLNEYSTQLDYFEIK